MQKRLGTFYSWNIYSEDFAVKKCDKTFFEYGTSGVPKQICWFWRADILTKGEKRSLVFEYDSQEYTAAISKATTSERVGLLWDSRLKKKLFNLHQERKKVCMAFWRVDVDHYIMYFCDEKVDFSLNDEERYIKSLTFERLKKIALKRSAKKTPDKKEAIVVQKKRDPYIAEYVRLCANGICQLCNNPAPFKRLNGEPYLESHHIIWLSKGGEDTVDNTVALCPNCHRKMHIVSLPEDVKFLMAKNRMLKYSKVISQRHGPNPL